MRQSASHLTVRANRRGQTALAGVAPWIHPATGAARTSFRRVRAHRQHEQPGDVRQEWLTTVPFAFNVAGGQELRAAVATLASRLTPALADQP